MSERLLLVGGGGLAVTARDLLLASKRGTVAGVLDDRPDARGTALLDARVEGSFEERVDVFHRVSATAALVTIGGLRHMLVRGRYLETLETEGRLAQAVVHPTAVFGEGSAVGRGSLVGPQVVLGPSARLGRGCVVYSGAVVEHECELAENVYIAPGVLTGGRVKIGANCYLGIGARIADGLTIGSGSIVGAGAVVLNDVPSGTVVIGVPARVASPNTRYRSVS